MKRLWIRAHALTFLADAVVRRGDFAAAQRVRNVRSDLHDHDPNDMVVVEVDDDVADLMGQDTYLLACGKVLAADEEPPYLGSDTPESGVRG